METQKLNPMLEKVVEKFWEKFKEVKECRKIEGGQQYICEYNDTVLVVSGEAPKYGRDEYDIWINVPNVKGDWYGHVEVEYEQESGTISISQSVHMCGSDEYSVHMWEALSKLVSIIAAKIASARDEVYEEVKRQTPGKDLLELFVEQFWREFNEVAKKEGIKRIEGEEPKYVYVDGSRVYTIYGRKKGDLEYDIWIEAPNEDILDRSAYVDVFYFKDRGELSIHYSVGGESEEYHTYWGDLIKLATKVIAVAITAREKAYRAARRSQSTN